ncbi:hypothetical protein [Mycobacteroides franklinii]|uniref:hypothetical protein n=1 Tax=Mycobacteroides franklinii TaxID=948102 RepID=UPI0013FD6ABD|nr:hypothetical protein [Mycobacteroides franklinii]
MTMLYRGLGFGSVPRSELAPGAATATAALSMIENYSLWLGLTTAMHKYRWASVQAGAITDG